MGRRGKSTDEFTPLDSLSSAAKRFGLHHKRKKYKHYVSMAKWKRQEQLKSEKEHEEEQQMAKPGTQEKKQLEIMQNFAQRLAHSSDKSIRNKAVDSLRRFLSKRNDLSDLDYLRLWRALHFCFWLSDLPLVQQEMASRLASFVHSIPEKSALRFVWAFWITMIRDWQSLDKWRIDKYLMLMRHMLRESFSFLEQNKFRSDLVSQFIDVMSTTCLSPGTQFQLPPMSRSSAAHFVTVTCWSGIKSHVTDIYIEELYRASDGNIDAGIAKRLVAPFRNILATSSDPALKKKVREDVMIPLRKIEAGEPLFDSDEESQDADDQDQDTEESDSGDDQSDDSDSESDN